MYSHFFKLWETFIQQTIHVALSPYNFTIGLVMLEVSECLQEYSKSLRQTVELDRKKFNRDVIK